jgi:crotonobetainyl-CoA:carnitine CoA-transferase CaiB-like acyl-CoA transferase
MALEGVRIIDFTGHVAGPVASMLLADFGADVIKVEATDGEHCRRWGVARFGPKKDISSLFAAVNRNKRDIAVDLKSPEGLEIVQRLMATADVVMENLNAGVAERLGVGYEQAREIKPDIIYCSISGFGKTGPWRGLPGYDSQMQALGGVSSITGEEGRPAVRVGPSTIDFLSGTHAALGVMMALRHRDLTGEGQLVDTSLYEATLQFMSPWIADYTGTGVELRKFGPYFPFLSPCGNFLASDGEFYIAVSAGPMWHAFCKMLERPGLDDDPRFVDNSARCVNQEELYDILRPIFAANTVDYWLRTGETFGIPVAPIRGVSEVVLQEQALARDMIVDCDTASPVRTAGLPIKLGRSPAKIRSDAAPLGRDSREVLVEVGYGTDDLDRLVNEGVIVE